MAEAAGSVKIRVTSDTKELQALQAQLKDALAEIKELRAEMASLKSASSSAAATVTKQATATKAAASADKARAAELKKLQAEYDATAKQIQVLEERAEAYLNLGLSSDADPHVDEIYEQEAALADELDVIQGKMSNLEAEGVAAHEAIAQSAREAAEAEAEAAQSTGTTTDALKSFSKGAGAFVRSSSSVRGGVRTMGTALNSTAGKIGLAAGVTVLAAKTIGDALADCYDEGMEFLGDIADGFAEVASSAADAALDAIGDAADSAADAVGDLAGKVGSLASSIASSGLNELMDLFNDQLDEAQDACLLAGNAVNSFEESLANVGNALVSAFSPIIDVVVPYINTLVEALADVINTLGMLFAALSGSTTYTKLVSSGLDSVSGSAEDASNNLAAFDEIDVLDQDTGSSSGSSSGSGLTTEEVEIPEELLAIADDLSGWLDSVDWEAMGYEFAQNLADMLNSINWDEIQAAAEQIASKIADFINGFFANEELAEAIGHTIAQMLNTALIFAYTLLTEIDFYQIGEWVGTAINTAVEEFDWELLGSTIAAGVNAAIDFALGLLQTVDFTALGQGIGTSLQTALMEIDWDGMANVVLWGIQSITDLINGFCDNIDFAAVASEMIDGINLLVAGMTIDENGEARSVWDENGEAVGRLINEFFDGIVEFVTTFPYIELAEAILTWFKSAIEEIDWADIATSISSFINGLLDMAETFLTDEEAQQDLIDAIGELVDGIDVEEIGKRLSKIIQEVGEYLQKVGDESGAFEAVGTLMIEAVMIGAQLKWQEFTLSLSTWFAGIGELFDSWAEEQGEKELEQANEDLELQQETTAAIGEFWGGLWESLILKQTETDETMTEESTAQSETQQNIFSELCNQLSAFFTSFCSEVKTAASTTMSNVQTTITTALTAISEFWNATWEAIQKFVTDAWNGICELVTESMDTVDQIITDVLTAVSEWWDETWTTISDTAEEIWDGICTFVSDFMDDVNETITTVMDDVSEAWEDTWSGMKSTVKSIINGIIGFINSLISGVETMVNAIVSAINSISIDLPEIMGGGHIGFSLSSVSLPRVPTLAEGAVIRGGDPFAAILGDQPAGQTNIETPLDTMIEAFKTALDEYGSAGGINTVVLEVNGEDIAHATLDDYISEINRRGVSVQTVVQGA